jgi:hypothetical protein
MDFFANEIRMRGGHEKLLQLTNNEFKNIIGHKFDPSLGKDMSTLIFNPRGNRLEVASPRDRFKVVCSHKRESKPGLFFCCFLMAHTQSTPYE